MEPLLVRASQQCPQTDKLELRPFHYCRLPCQADFRSLNDSRPQREQWPSRSKFLHSDLLQCSLSEPRICHQNQRHAPLLKTAHICWPTISPPQGETHLPTGLARTQNHCLLSLKYPCNPWHCPSRRSARAAGRAGSIHLVPLSTCTPSQSPHIHHRCCCDTMLPRQRQSRRQKGSRSPQRRPTQHSRDCLTGKTPQDSVPS
mmetsp:Transcript_11067/g.21127  ORF Transcript_11067/g.21127 Transcript_11067/m.21127 type:complete len:202 (-) Transcript_11067:2229-2834(-)